MVREKHFWGQDFLAYKNGFEFQKSPKNDTHSIWESQSLAHISVTGKLQNLFLLKEKLSCICLETLTTVKESCFKLLCHQKLLDLHRQVLNAGIF